jgi:hypothetical protein
VLHLVPGEGGTGRAQQGRVEKKEDEELAVAQACGGRTEAGAMKRACEARLQWECDRSEIAPRGLGPSRIGRG